MAGKKRMAVGTLKEAKPKEMTGGEISDFLARVNGAFFNIRYGAAGCMGVFRQAIVEVRQEPQNAVMLLEGRLVNQDGEWFYRNQKGVSFPVVALSRD